MPGTRIGSTKEYAAGPGTYVFDDFIHASVLGMKKISTNKEGHKCVEVEHHKPPAIVPQAGDIATARVTRINNRFAAVEILCVGSTVLPSSFPGQIRARDVRELDTDTVEIYKAFRPSDIVRAKIISLGDSRSYFLSTASNELGVIIAQSTAGAIMVPISWQEMQCPLTKAKEFRKVAKVDS